MIETRRVLRGELALLLAVIINSLGVVLMLHSGSGISAISSVPYAFSEVLPRLSLGTWTYIFQGILVISLMIIKKRFVPEYLFSFVVGFAFGIMVDVHKSWMMCLPITLPLQALYFVISYLLICFGIALSNRCGLPIIPTDLFPREVSDGMGLDYSKVKISFDVICLFVTASLTFLCLGQIKGLGIGTVLAAFSMGKGVSFIGAYLDQKVKFISFLDDGIRLKQHIQIK